MIEFESTSGEKRPKSQTTIVYDPQDGRIVYVHEFIGDGTGLYGSGGRKERERIALESVKRHHNDAKRLRVMHLPRNFRFKFETLYRVDLRAGRLAGRPGPPAGRKRTRRKRAR